MDLIYADIIRGNDGRYPPSGGSSSFKMTYWQKDLRLVLNMSGKKNNNLNCQPKRNDWNDVFGINLMEIQAHTATLKKQRSE